MKKHIFRNWTRLSGLESLSQQDNSVSRLTNSFASGRATAETYIIPDNSRLAEQFQRNHPHLYHVLNTKLFQNYHGI